MGFDNCINDEHKIRISLSDKALITITDDMNIFSESNISRFINTIFEDFRSEAKSSVFTYLEQRKLKLDNLFASLDLDDSSKENIKKQLLQKEKEELLTTINKYSQHKTNSRLYHINKNNIDFLINSCNEDIFFRSPSLYMKCVIEEYCSLPFIKREQIYQKEIYDKIEHACNENLILKITTPYQGKQQLFIVYPYKIVSDPSDTQEYLTCYSRKNTDNEKDKVLASFSMARLTTVSVLRSKFHLTAKEISHINDYIIKYSSAYLLGKPEEIHVRLTEKG